MNTLIVALCLLAMGLVAPSAAATCNPAPLVGLCLGEARAEEGHFGEGTCESGSSFDYTRLRYAHSYGVTVEVIGASDCRGVPGQYAYENDGFVVFASAAPGNGVPGTVATLYHYHTSYSSGGETSFTCQTGAAAAGTGPQAFGCPAGPLPDPGWGHLLP